MNSKQFLKIIENMLINKAVPNKNPPKLFIFVVSPELPLFIKIFNAHLYQELWFKKINK